MKYKNILFDLDGTLVDSSQGTVESIVYATEKMKWPTPGDATLRAFIGPPLLESFIKLGKSQAEAEQAVKYYREYYQEKGMYENTVYPQIPATLKALVQAGVSLYVATSKPEYFAKQIIQHIDMASYFTGVYGASMDNRRSQKGDVIHYGLTKAAIQAETSVTMMVGDRSHDIVGAKANDLSSVGVLYGFGDRQELAKAGAAHIIAQPSELLTLF